MTKHLIMCAKRSANLCLAAEAYIKIIGFVIPVVFINKTRLGCMYLSNNFINL